MTLSLHGLRVRLRGTKRLSLPGWRMPEVRRFRFGSSRPISQWFLAGAFILYAVVCVVLYFKYEEPWILGQGTVRIGADSITYWANVALKRVGAGESLVSLGANFLGPVLVGLVFQNGFAVLCFNIALFILAMKIAASIPGLNVATFGWLILLNAVLMPALISLNKEILVFFAVVLAAKYVLSNRRSLALLAFTLLVSFIVRWEQAAIILLYLLLKHSPIRARPKLMLACVVLGLSVAYPVMFGIFGIDPQVFAFLGDSANTILRLNTIQAAGGFFLVVLPKILMNMTGNLAQPWLYWSGEIWKGGFEDPQQQIFQPLGCLAFLLVFGYAVVKRRLSLARPLPMLMALTMVITAITPFIQPRYLYPAYIFLALELALPETALARSAVAISPTACSSSQGA